MQSKNSSERIKILYFSGNSWARALDKVSEFGPLIRNEVRSFHHQGETHTQKRRPIIFLPLSPTEQERPHYRKNMGVDLGHCSQETTMSEHK